MRYMSIVSSAEDRHLGPPPQALMEAIARLGEEATKAGTMVDMGGLLPTAAGFRVRVARGKVTMTDGPFSEAKEVIGGFAVFEVSSREEVVEWARRFMELHRIHWPEWEGETEVRQMFDGPGCPDFEAASPQP